MNYRKLPVAGIIALFTACTFSVSAQKSNDWKLDKMPADLEMDYALSSLPAHLRAGATVYLLDPEKGYYIARQGTNGFVAFVNRTEWEWPDFEDTYAAISYDAEGAKTYMPVFLDVAKMRASGKYTSSQIRDIIVKRVKNGTYKAPARTGVSYMLGPVMRTHPGTPKVVTINMPHYMFYAPNVSNSDIGAVGDSVSAQDPFIIGANYLFGKGNNIFNLIILPAGEMEKARIMEEDKDLLKRLAAYKSFLIVEPASMHH